MLADASKLLVLGLKDWFRDTEHDDLNVLITLGMCGKLADRRLGLRRECRIN